VTASRHRLPELDACTLFTRTAATEVLAAAAEQPDEDRRLDTRDEASGVALSNCMYAASGTLRTAHVVIRYVTHPALPGPGRHA